MLIMFCSCARENIISSLHGDKGLTQIQAKRMAISVDRENKNPSISGVVTDVIMSRMNRFHSGTDKTRDVLVYLKMVFSRHLKTWYSIRDLINSYFISQKHFSVPLLQIEGRTLSTFSGREICIKNLLWVSETIYFLLTLT